MNLYEFTYILRSDLEEDALQSVQERITGRINDAGGEVVKSEGWGRRRLAYPIERVREGFYFTTILRMPSDHVRSLETQLRLVPEILRFLVIAQEEKNINLSGSLIPSMHRPAPTTPTSQEATEASPATTPEGETPAPGTGEAAPAEEPSATETEAAAITEEPSVTETEAAPATEEPSAVETEAAPVIEEPSAVETEAAPVIEEPSSGDTEAAATEEPSSGDTEAAATEEPSAVETEGAGDTSGNDSSDAKQTATTGESPDAEPAASTEGSPDATDTEGSNN